MNWDNHIYINLEKRTDRNEKTIKQLKNIGINKPNRFNAVFNKKGIVGCAESHIGVVQYAMDNDLPYLCVFEDDIHITNPKLLKVKINNLINTDFDVLMLGGNNYGGQKIDNNLLKVEQCFTTTAYIIKKHYYSTWLENLKEGLNILKRTDDRKYSLDQHNHKLQKKDKWYLLIPICIIQRKGYSDIDNEKIDYESLMLNYNKLII